MRWLTASGALVALVALIVGVPVGLITHVGKPWPAEGVVLNAPLSDNAIIGLLAGLVWILWAQLLACIAVETISVLRHRHADIALPGVFGIQRHLARTLVTSIVVALVAAPVTTTTTATATPTAPATATTDGRASDPATSPLPGSDPSASALTDTGSPGADSRQVT